MAHKNDERNEAILQLRGRGYHPRQIVAALKDRFPGLTVNKNVVYMVCARHGLTRRKHERERDSWVRGVEAGPSKLTPEQVVWVRENCTLGCRKMGAKAVARKLGVHPTTVTAALEGRTWAHID